MKRKTKQMIHWGTLKFQKNTFPQRIFHQNFFFFSNICLYLHSTSGLHPNYLSNSVLYPGRFWASRLFFQFSISLRCYHGWHRCVNFENLSFWISGNWLFLESFLYTSCTSSLPSFLLSSQLLSCLLTFCPDSPLSQGAENLVLEFPG